MRFALSACLGLLTLLPSAGAAADLPDLKKRGSLRVLVVLSDEELHFFSVKPGTPPGFDQEILQRFAERQQLKIEVVPVVGWDALIPSLLKGKGEVIAGGFTASETRKKQIAFTSEVFPTRNVVITRKPHRVVRTLAELKEERIGTIKGTTMAEALSAAAVHNVDESFEAGEFIQALKNRKITAAVDGVEAALKAKQADPDLQIGMFLGPPESLAYGVRKEDVELLRALDAYVVNLRKTPTWSQLAVKYFGDAAPEILRKTRSE